MVISLKQLRMAVGFELRYGRRRPNVQCVTDNRRVYEMSPDGGKHWLQITLKQLIQVLSAYFEETWVPLREINAGNEVKLLQGRTILRKKVETVS